LRRRRPTCYSKVRAAPLPAPLPMMPFEKPFLNDPVRLRVAAGARQVETELLRDVASLLRDAVAAPELLAQPVRLVVPSHSLRLHVAAALVRHAGRAVAGVSVQTLRGLAVEVLERAGEPILPGEALLPVLVRQEAREEATLRGALDDLVDGYAGVRATVADLLDAGFTDAHAEVLDEVLTQHADPHRALARARALVRVGGRVAAALARHGLGRSSTLLQRAREIVERDGAGAVPSRAIVIHGFADATGVAADFLEALLRRCNGRVYADCPPDPALPAQTDSGVAFSRRFLERFGALPASPDSGADVAQVQMISAPGGDAEARAVAQHVRALIDAGTRPETIAIVARDLDAYAIPLRVQLGRLGVPFSGAGARGPISATGRRLHSLLELLARREDAATDRWLDVLEISRLALPPGELSPSVGADLRLGLRAHGAARVRDVAALDVAMLLAGRRTLPLPVRRGLSLLDDDDGDKASALPVARRRTLAASVLANAVNAARALLGRWARWPATASLPTYVACVRDALTAELGWSLQTLNAAMPQLPAVAVPEVFAVLAALEHELPSGAASQLPLAADDFVLLLRSACTDIGTPSLGGVGGGVQVLNVVEARARNWEHLFVVGLNRDVFPRTVREDPLLPDALRRALASVLPDLPIKQSGFDEERYLFAQLLSASPHVTLSWQSEDDEGRPQVASPLIERLRLTRPDILVQRAPGLCTHPGAGVALLTPYEHAVCVGLSGEHTRLEDVWQVAIAHTASPGDPQCTAAARVAVLAEFDGRRRGEPRLGPYFGFIGAPREPADPRLGPLYVTTLERMAACPWQTFVRRLLAIEPPPDPLAALPGIDALLLGSTVHRTLEHIVGDAVGNVTELSAAVACQPVPVGWPDAARVTHLLHTAAAEVLRDAGIGLAGLAGVLVVQAQPYLEEARRLDWSVSAVPVLGAELEGVLTVHDDAGRARAIRFRADRVDARDGGVRVTDYKTGKPVSLAKTSRTRDGHFLAEVAAGKRLQAVAYVRGALAAGAADAEGRYLFVKPDLDAAVRSTSVRSADAAVTAAFDGVVHAVLQAWDTGSFFPRLVEPHNDVEPQRCGFCDVAPACLRRDSGARARLREWTAGAPAVATAAAERALLALWNLGQDIGSAKDDCL
jgi:hypothetical protein